MEWEGRNRTHKQNKKKKTDYIKSNIHEAKKKKRQNEENICRIMKA